MKNGLSDITLVIDRSGSMAAVQADAEGGVNRFIQDQGKVPGEALLTLVQFDTEYEFLHRGKPIKEVPRYSLIPRGMTALLDAVGKAINETGERLAHMKEDDRPSHVFFVIVTDGHENSSKEFSKTQVKEMIERQKKDYNWQFTFIGADASAFDDASGIGIGSAQALHYDPGKTEAMYGVMSNAVSCSRTSGRNLSYSDEDRCAVRDSSTSSSSK